MTIIEKLRWHYFDFIKHHFPFLWSKHLYRINCGKVTDFSNPKDLNEKIQWLMFYTDTSLWTILADKYAVRDYVVERIGEKYLVPLLYKWDSPEDIDFKSLPAKFVIKPNNGSYDTIICRNKATADFDKIRRKMGKAFKCRFGYDTAEMHYLRIKPCIIVEELLECETPGGLIDYKIWCFEGKPYCIFVCANRDNIHHSTDFIYYDLNWERHPEFIKSTFKNSFHCPRPDNLAELLQIASKLSAGLPQARIDLYDINNHIFFGEITLSSNFGMMPYFTEQALNEMGAQFSLPKRSIAEKFSTFRNRWMPKF